MQTGVTVIIRSAGERTESLCRRLALQQVPEENVHTVSNAPFSATLKDSFVKGVEQGLEWTLCLDADVLICPDAAGKLVSLAERCRPNVCEVQGLVLDKFFGGPRQGGPHLYRTELLPLAIQHIPGAGSKIRPEHHVLTRMKGAGFPWVQKSVLLGLHDFEQYYRDIYRKCFVQADKHDYLAGLFVQYWRQMREKEEDFRLAMLGLAAGMAYESESKIDSRFLAEEIDNILREHGFEEKGAIGSEFLKRYDVEKIISGWEEPEAYTRHFPARAGLDDRDCFELFAKVRRETGTLKFMLWVFGRFFYGIGRKIVRFARS